MGLVGDHFLTIAKAHRYDPRVGVHEHLRQVRFRNFKFTRLNDKNCVTKLAFLHYLKVFLSDLLDPNGVVQVIDIFGAPVFYETYLSQEPSPSLQLFEVYSLKSFQIIIFGNRDAEAHFLRGASACP